MGESVFQGVFEIEVTLENFQDSVVFPVDAHQIIDEVLPLLDLALHQQPLFSKILLIYLLDRSERVLQRSSVDTPEYLQFVLIFSGLLSLFSGVVRC